MDQVSPSLRPGALQGAAVLRHRRGHGGRPRRRDRRRCGRRPHRRRLRDHPAAERAGAPCRSRAPGGRGEGEGAGLRRAPRRGAAGGRRRGGGDGRARDRQGGAGRAAERRGPCRAGRSRSAPFDGAALLALRRRRPRRRDRPAQGRLGRARADLGAADRHAQRGVRSRLSRPARHRAASASTAPCRPCACSTVRTRPRWRPRPPAISAWRWTRPCRPPTGARQHLSLAQVDLRGGRRGRDLASRRDGAAAARRTPHRPTTFRSAPSRRWCACNCAASCWTPRRTRR